MIGTENDHTMSRYLLGECESLVKALNPTCHPMEPSPNNFTAVLDPAGSYRRHRHVIGADLRTSVVNCGMVTI